MIKRHELLMDYLCELVDNHGDEAFKVRGDYVQLVVCGYVVEDLYEMIGEYRERQKVESKNLSRVMRLKKEVDEEEAVKARTRQRFPIIDKHPKASKDCWRCDGTGVSSWQRCTCVRPHKPPRSPKDNPKG